MTTEHLYKSLILTLTITFVVCNVGGFCDAQQQIELWNCTNCTNLNTSSSTLTMISKNENATNNITTIQNKIFAELCHLNQQIIAYVRVNNISSLVYGLTIRGKPVWRRAYGYAELENFVPAKLSTHYRLASISKSFTAGLFGTLVDRGLVQFNSSIHQYIPENVSQRLRWLNETANITIEQLLSHTAGVWAVKFPDDFQRNLVATNVTDSLRMLQYKQSSLEFKPGENFTYSNDGYQLIGAAIETLTNQTFQEVMENFLHEKLQLNETFVHQPNKQLIHDWAFGYIGSIVNGTVVNKENYLTEHLDLSVSTQGYWPAGGLVSTVDDVLRFGQLMIDSYKEKPGALLTKQTLQKMWTIHTDKVFQQYYTPDTYYGLGWMITQLQRNFTVLADQTDIKQKTSSSSSTTTHPPYYWHSGNLKGISTTFMIYPQEEIVGVVLANKGLLTTLNSLVEQAVDRVLPLWSSLIDNDENDDNNKNWNLKC